MNFFLDENFPKSAVKLLSERDHTVFDIRSTAKEWATDDAIFNFLAPTRLSDGKQSRLDFRGFLPAPPAAFDLSGQEPE